MKKDFFLKMNTFNSLHLNGHKSCTLMIYGFYCPDGIIKILYL